MDLEYDRKFEEMKQYIPFLENMIKRLETVPASANPRQAQLDKIKSLRDLLLDKKKRMKMENLLKCEQVLLNLYTKVEQKETLPGPDTKKSADPSFPSDSTKDTNDNCDLNLVRRKLKSVASKSNHQEVEETLPEIARANETEVVCTPGSKEPALFQRRPNKPTISPSVKELIQTEKKSPQKSVQKRNYTRVLVSPEQSHRRWSTTEERSNKPLFSRRSPQTSPRRFSPSYYKKERKKSSETKKQKRRDLNITLNVPEESLNSLNTADIFSRIINCSDNDVDIDTLRDLRKQILGELKHTGTSEDISDLILKSYKKKKSKNKNKKAVEVEEGELSDSESEAIESIYGSLVLVDKDMGTSSEVKISTEKDAQPRKIQICFVINSDKETTDKDIPKKDNDKIPTVTDKSEFEMFGNKEKSKIDEVNEESKKKEFSGKEIKENSVIISQQKEQATGSVTIGKPMIIEKQNTRIDHDLIKAQEVITIDSEDDDQLKSKVESSSIPHRNDNVINFNASTKVSEIETTAINFNTTNKVPETETTLQKSDKTSNAPTNAVTFKANFYKPLNEKEIEETNDLQLENKTTELQKNTVTSQVGSNNPTMNTENKTILPPSEKKTVLTEVFESAKKSIETECNITKTTNDNTEIPLLNLDPVIPEPPAKQAVSEIDILQALKNEILSDNIPIPGTEGVTPALHQPKVTKVANAQGIIRKKRISIEKYKEKSVPSKPSLFIDTDFDIYTEEQSKKQSLKLTEKERERFKLAAKLALDDSSDEDINKEYSLDDIYGNLAPESPEIDDIDKAESTPPIIIPVDPVKTTMASSKSDVDMRTLLPLLSPTEPKPAPPPGPNTLVSSTFNDTARNEKRDQNYRPPAVDPRLKWELNNPFGKDSPNSHVVNPERTPRPPMNYPPNMTPSRTPCLTPNARTFEMTPSHMSFEYEENSSRKHVYAPSFPIFEPRDHREMSVNKESHRPHWEPNEEMTRESRRTRWEKSEHRQQNYLRNNDPRSTSAQRDNSPDYQRFRNNDLSDKYQNDRRDDYAYSRLDCPRTPIHSFGRAECPATPTPSFGRMETPTTPVHPFGRSDCPPTPIHPFVRSECPSTPSHTFGRSECPSTPSHPFGRSECPSTPSHPFGRSECPTTPSHPFGRSECPTTPSHPFGRSDLNMASMTPTHPFGRSEYSQNHSNTAQKFIKDPRLNRNTDYKSSSLNCDDDRDPGYYKERRTSDKPNIPYNASESYRNYGREQSVGRNDRSYERNGRPYNREQASRREPTVGRPITKDYDSQLYFTKQGRHNNDYHFETVKTSYNEFGPLRNYQRASSVGRTLTSDDRFNRSSSQTHSVGRNFQKPVNDNTLSVKPQSGRSFTIDTSVNRTFQEFLSNKGMQTLDYTFDARRQRATSVGRSLTRESSIGRTYRESSIGRTLPKQSQPWLDNSGFANRNNFVRARSMGREMVPNSQERSFKDIKADFKHYSANFKAQEAKKKTFNYVEPRTRKENREKQQQQPFSSINTKQGYSPRKNNRDPRLRREQKNDKNKYGAEEKNRDRRNYGIVYSNDNITKGTILGSGYGVKNYKIPKIKRVTEEKEDTEKIKDINQREKGSVDELKAVEKKKIVTDSKEKDRKSSITQKSKQNKDAKLNLRKKQDGENEPALKTDIRATRMNAKGEEVAVVKNRKVKKSVISDSDSDSQGPKESHDELISCKKETAKIANRSSITVQADETDKNEDDLSSLGIGDLDLFPDNLASDPVLDNINALIADLDNDIDDSKDNTSKQFTKEISLANMLESITSAPSPTDTLKQSTVEESLNDLNELINEDLNKSVPESQEKKKHLKPEIMQAVQENVNVSEKITTVSAKSQINNSQVVSKHRVINEPKETIKDSIDIQRNDLEKISDKLNLDEKKSVKILLGEEMNKINQSIDISRDSTEAIVSTTDNPKEPYHEANKVENKIEEQTDECYPDRSSTPDSTNEIVEAKPCDEELPDSTNEMHPDISSSHDLTETSHKQTKESPRTGTAPQMDSIENVLSILQDKAKIKELLCKLNNESAVSEKIKKKLERLSEIVSDDEDTNTEIKETAIGKEEPKPTKESEGVETLEQIKKSNCSEVALETIKVSKQTEGSPDITEETKHKEEHTSLILDESNCKEYAEKVKPTEPKTEETSVKLGEAKDNEKRALEINDSENKDEVASENIIIENNTNKSSEKIEENKSDTEAPASVKVDELKKNLNIQTGFVSNRLKNQDKKIRNSLDETEKNANEENSKTLQKTEDKIVNEDNSAPLDKNEENSELKNDYKTLDSDDTNAESDSEQGLITKPQISRTGRKKPMRKKSGKWKKRLTGKEKRVTRSKAVQKKPKVASRELKQLQEDIKEMFLSDDILNATGIRMCRLAKLVDEKTSSQEEKLSIGSDKAVVVLEKFKNKDTQGDVSVSGNIRKKPGSKSTTKAPKSDSSVSLENKLQKNKTSTHKPGPKSKTISHQETSEPSEIDYDSASEKKSDALVSSSDSENESLASSRSFGSSEVLIELKKKPKRKRRGGAWQSGVIKPKKKKKVEGKPTDTSLDDNILVPQRQITIPDMNCFTDKTYCFLKNVFTYACRLCDYSGNEIVHHYKRRHPHSEIPLSRMNSVIAREAIEQCEEINFQAISKIATDKYVCRFCFKEFSDKRKTNHLEVFFWHVVSTHTGEYKQLCSECINVTRCPFNLDIPPPPKDLKGQLIGFICGKCNFTQISLENLKTHVIVRHNDEQTEVCAINLAVMTKKTINTLIKQSASSTVEETPRLLRSSRSTLSVTEASDDRSDITESTDRLSEHDAPKRRSFKTLGTSSTESPKVNKIQSKITFESEDCNVKNEEKITERSKSRQLDDSPNLESGDSDKVSDIAKSARRTTCDDIVDYPHFKISYSETGAKEYVCCINGKDNHYKTSLLISMKKHVQTKHPEKWDGYCYICKVIVTTQGAHDFKECFHHLLDKHIDNFSIIERVLQSEEKPDAVEKTPHAEEPTVEKSPLPLPYINVRPIAEMLCKELENIPSQETPAALPRIQNDSSFDTVEAPLPSSTYPRTETASPRDTTQAPTYSQVRKKFSTPEESFKYEEAQAEVMKQKHQVVLESMMSHEKLVKIFKCAGRYCYFTSDSLEAALLHASTHQRIGGENALLCSYCDFDCSGNAIALVTHVFKIHGRCPFACAHCFYRAAASQLVRAHMIRVHGQQYEKDAVLKTETVTPGTNDSGELLPREDVVQYYTCADGDSNCKFKTYTQGKFCDHLLRHKPPYVCYICSTGLPTPSELVQHMKSHNMKVYQCTWCYDGADNEPDLLDHASTRHPGKQPQAYLRVITTKDGSSKMMVLPLAQFNKSTVLTQLVTSSNTSENPVREAERSIELEKLIGFMLVTSSPGPSDKAPEGAGNSEEPFIPTEMESVEQPRLDTPPPSTSVQGDNLALQLTPVLKTEPADDVSMQDKHVADVICLDSDEDTEIDFEPRSNVIDLSDDEAPSSQLKSLLETRKPLPSSLKDVSFTPIDVLSTRKDASTPKDATAPNDASTPKYTLPIPQDAPSAPKDTPSTPNDAVSTPKGSSTPDPKFMKIPADILYQCPKCRYICKTLQGFKRHSHCFTKLNDTIVCSHCSLTLNNRTEFYKHLENDHRADDPQTKDPAKDQNAVCGICELRHRSLSFIKSHLRTEHGITNLVVGSKYGDSGELLYTVRESPKPKPAPKRKLSAGNAESLAKRKRYGPQDVYLLPTKPILDELAFCSLCEFSSKVRLNLVRHLQGHADKQPVAQTAPVNPVPHLETNEKHFDKMVNLASSSIVTRAPDKTTRVDSAPVVSLMIPPEAASRYPKYVAERQRLTCGAIGCSYISVDESMLKCHWETLHAGTNEYHCVHCPPYQHLDTSKPLTASRIIAHLKMHDVRLYACSSCSYYHYKRQVVEKHLNETHKGAGQVMVVREEFTALPPGVTQPSTAAPTMDLKPWQCGLCKFKSMLRQEVAEHCAKLHSSKMQFKCPNCPFRTSTIENVTKHRSNSHPTSKEDVIYYYYREGSMPDEIDGTPRWLKQRQKMGIVDPEVKTEADAPNNPIPPPVASTSLAVDLNLVKQESDDSNAVESIEDLCKRFGQFCDPNGLKFKCPLCKAVVEDAKDAMQSHLYEELKYRKWSCSICSYKAFHKTGLKEHMFTEHRQNRDPVQLPVNVKVEKWVSELLNHQTALIEKTKEAFAKQRIQDERPRSNLLSPEAKKPETAPEPKVEELQEAFGPFGASVKTDFCCPKCDFKAKEEVAMRNHLETELNKIRWRCSHCAGKFQEYHEAQLHCKSVHPGQSARPVEALRDPAKRAAWVAAVLRTQKLTMPIAEPQMIEPSLEESNIPSAFDNSLLVVRYEERVPTPEEEMLIRRKKQSATTADSDEERLIIDEAIEEKEPKHKLEAKSCPHCEFSTKYASALRDHILRHYNLKPYTCGYCKYSCYVYQCGRHSEIIHPDLPPKFSKTVIPDGPPVTLILSKRGKKVTSSDEVYKPKDDPLKKDDGPKVICLVCERAVLETDIHSHVHEKVTAQFAKKGDVVVKCCNCLALILNVHGMQQHHNDTHPNANLNYAFHKLQSETRDIHYCGHCRMGFKYIRDLRSHHNAVHRSLQLKYTLNTFLRNTDIIECDDEASTSKRILEDNPQPPLKRVARKSTTKLPSQRVAKKSTTKLPYNIESDSEFEEEYSYYGTRPNTLQKYASVTTMMPFCNTMMPFSVKKLGKLVKINPVVVVKDFKKDFD